MKKRNNVIHLVSEVFPYKHKIYEVEIKKLEDRIRKSDIQTMEKLEEIMKRIREE